MFRKLALALGTTVAISSAALIPTTASAHGFHGHHFHGHGWGWGVGVYAPVYVSGPDCYVVKRIINTPAGPVVRRVTVCD